ncbi:MAG: reverse transcriptase/maturase family protein [bacterium]|nr:reverse transcriptase/maturase family protein [bacterium]
MAKIAAGGGSTQGIIFPKKLTHTYQDIISPENLLEAWQEFLRGKRNKKDVQEFQHRLMDNIFLLHRDLKNKTYIHGDYTAFNISDPKPRNIHKANVKDRLLHHAIYRIIYPFFDRKFIADSYSCRIGKGTHRAMNRFRSFAYKVSKNNTKTCWILKCDIKKFFASIDQEILIAILKKHIENQDIIWLLERVISSFNSGSPGKGLPLGNLTSQLLANVYMNEFDQFIKHRLKVKYYIRYADDFVFMSTDRDFLLETVRHIVQFLREELSLELNPNKVFVKTLSSGLDFLGWVHFPDHRVLRTTTKRRMFQRLADNTSKETTSSYLGMLRHGNTQKLKKQITL